MKFIVDFNSVEDDIIWTQRGHRQGQAFILDDLSIGSVVSLGDDEGRSAQGIVRSLVGELIEVQILWETWIDHSAMRDVPTSFHSSADAVHYNSEMLVGAM